MEFLRQSADEIEIRGPESKYDTRKLNSYPSKVGCFATLLWPLPFFRSCTPAAILCPNLLLSDLVFRGTANVCRLVGDECFAENRGMSI